MRYEAVHPDCGTLVADEIPDGYPVQEGVGLWCPTCERSFWHVPEGDGEPAMPDEAPAAAAAAPDGAPPEPDEAPAEQEPEALPPPDLPAPVPPVPPAPPAREAIA